MRALWGVLASVVLLAAVEADADDDEVAFGPAAWACSSVGSGSGSGSVSSEERGNHLCACLPAAAGSSSLIWTKLDCSHRGFESVASGPKLPYHVRILDLSWNHIRFLEGGMFDRFRPLEVLNLGHNGLIKISEYALAGLTALTVLNLNHNRLAELSEHQLMNLSALKELDLSWNDLKYLPPRLFRNITGLDSLSLSGNIRLTQYIHESPEALKDVLQRGLRCLKLNHMQLTDLPENLFNLAYNLEELHITNNFFTKLPDLYIGSLKRLDVSGSNISVVQTGNFLNLPSLEVLHMNRMKLLTRVEVGAFVGLKHLHELYIEKCLNLTSFDGMAFGGPTYNAPPLRNFSLKHNGLQTLSKSLLPVLSNIEHLKLQGNPWDCDCRLRWFKEMNFSKEIEHVRCYFPESLHNRTIASLERSDFVCMTKKSRVLYGLMITMAVLFGLISLFAIVASFDTLRRKCSGQRVSQRIRYDPMLVQLHPNNAENYGEAYEGPNTVSFISTVR